MRILFLSVLLFIAQHNKNSGLKEQLKEALFRETFYTSDRTGEGDCIFDCGKTFCGGIILRFIYRK